HQHGRGVDAPLFAHEVDGAVEADFDARGFRQPRLQALLHLLPQRDRPADARPLFGRMAYHSRRVGSTAAQNATIWRTTATSAKRSKPALISASGKVPLRSRSIGSRPCL